MRNGVIHTWLLILSTAVTLLAAELNPEVLSRLEFFLNYDIVECLDMLENEAFAEQGDEVKQASVPVAGLGLKLLKPAVIISTQTPHVATTTVVGGAK
ncbi:MAG TPA: hypothetical protein PLL10_07555 [Elusimicrobiales bacterium]|nr:hypothetical protein [Elusimicrobiales bacterium]